MTSASAEFEAPLNRAPTILAIVVTRENPTGTLRTLERQTVRADRVVVSDHRFRDSKTGPRVGKSINRTLTEVPWREYDYILRLDGDSQVPPDFVEKALKENADVVGSGGSGLLFRREVLEAMRGHWPELDGEDSYFVWKARELGFKQTLPSVRGTGRPFGREYTITRFLSWGFNCYRIGNEPVNFLRMALVSAKAAKRPGFLLAIPAYFGCFLIRMRRLDVADFVTRTQIRLVSRGLRRRISSGPAESGA
jgi:hypothetical protein